MSVFPVRSSSGFLAASIIRDVTESRAAEERERQHMRDLDLLSRTAIGFVELPSQANLHEFIAQQLQLLFGDKAIVAVSEYDAERRTYFPRAFCGLERVRAVAKKLVGHDPVDLTGDFGPQAKMLLLSGVAEEVPEGLATLAPEVIRGPLVGALQAALGVTRVYVGGFVRHGQMLGGVTVVQRTGCPEPNLTVVNAFLRQASVAMGRRMAEVELRESEERFRQIADNVHEVFWLERADTRRVLYVNLPFEAIWGRQRAELIADPGLWLESVLPADRDEVSRALAQLDTREFNAEFRIMRPAGDVRWIRSRIFAIRDADGTVYRRAGIAADITEFKDAAEQARQQREQLMQADKMASLGVLVSGVAHEINNPNNLITLNAGLLSRFWKAFAPAVQSHEPSVDARQLGGLGVTEAAEKMGPLVDGIANAADRIKRIVGNLRDFARADSGRFDEVVSVRAVVEAAVSIVQNLIRKSTQHFSVVHDESMPPLRGNNQKLEQVLINLITNACHALRDREQSVTITTCYDHEHNAATIEVADTGMGIPAELLTKVFDPFFTTKRDSGGTGLGLSVSYAIVQEHGGDLKLESTEGTGTTVRVLLPGPPN